MIFLRMLPEKRSGSGAGFKSRLRKRFVMAWPKVGAAPASRAWDTSGIILERGNAMRSRAAAAMFALAAACLPAGAQEDGSRDAVRNLEGYAHYKMGQYGEARRIWEELAAKGNTTALINLANLFEQGQGVEADRVRALAYVREAAERGDARAQYDLGLAYEKGDGVDRDIELAAGWLKRSAEGGNPDGQFAYGVMLATAKGRGLDKASASQRAEALDWLRKAKAGGHVEAADYVRVLEGEG
jgi:uncharacterized protein